MNIQIIGHGVDVTPAIRSFTTEKISRLMKHYQNIPTCHVTFEIEKLEQIAHATMLYQHNEVYAKAQAIDLYGAIDLLFEKLERQLEKIKQKKLGHQE